MRRVTCALPTALCLAAMPLSAELAPIFDLQKGMRITIGFTYLSPRDTTRASLVIMESTVTEKGLRSLGLEYEVPRLESVAAPKPANRYFPGPPRQLRVVSMEKGTIIATPSALESGDHIIFPFLWPGVAKLQDCSIVWLSQRSYGSVFFKRPAPWKLPAITPGGAAQTQPISTTLQRDSLYGSYTLRYNGRLAVVSVIRAHDDQQNFYLILQNRMNPLVLSARYGLLSGDEFGLAGGGYDVVEISGGPPLKAPTGK